MPDWVEGAVQMAGGRQGGGSSAGDPAAESTLLMQLAGVASVAQLGRGICGTLREPRRMPEVNVPLARP